jgi:hypothetical protein
MNFGVHRKNAKMYASNSGIALTLTEKANPEKIPARTKFKLLGLFIYLNKNNIARSIQNISEISYLK